MKTTNQGSHQADSLGRRSKDSQRRPIPEAVDMPLDADVIKHLREREKANAATSASVVGIGELTPHGDKKDLPPTAPGRSTRVSKDSDGSISQPNSDARPQPGKNSTDRAILVAIHSAIDRINMSSTRRNDRWKSSTKRSANNSVTATLIKNSRS